MIFLILPFRFCSAACFIASRASAFAGSMKAQVFMTRTSALSLSAVISISVCAISASILSESTIFFGQPSATKPTVTCFLRFFRVIAG